MAIPAYVNFESFHHAVAVNIGGSRAKCQAEFIVAAKGWTLCQINFVGDIGWDMLCPLRDDLNIGISFASALIKICCIIYDRSMRPIVFEDDLSQLLDQFEPSMLFDGSTPNDLEAW
jgi:hypothetical protein